MVEKMNREKEFEILMHVHELYNKLTEKYKTKEFLLHSDFVDPDMKRTLGFTFDEVNNIYEETLDEFRAQYNILIDCYYEYCSAIGDELDYKLYINGNKFAGNELNLWVLRNGKISENQTDKIGE